MSIHFGDDDDDDDNYVEFFSYVYIYKRRYGHDCRHVMRPVCCYNINIRPLIVDQRVALFRFERYQTS